MRHLRICIVGTSGSGKTTLARRLAARLHSRAIELDAINWRPGWRELWREESEEFKAKVAEAAAAEAWVADGNYRLALPILFRRATDAIWLDYPRSLVMRRVIGRSVARAIDAKELWPGTGNRERWRNWLSKGHPIRWAWATHAERRSRLQEVFADSRLAHLKVHRLTHPREAGMLIEELASAAAAEAEPTSL
ncbi:MAG: AAA family ATPase [Caulobacteraceae bacterium]